MVKEGGFYQAVEGGEISVLLFRNISVTNPLLLLRNRAELCCVLCVLSRALMF